MSDSAESVAQAFVRAINRQDVEALAELMIAECRFDWPCVHSSDPPPPDGGLRTGQAHCL